LDASAARHFASAARYFTVAHRHRIPVLQRRFRPRLGGHQWAIGMPSVAD
jgi:hypothetical protein